MVGTVVGQYRIVAQIGRGTSGIVYKGVDETLNREVAIKILNPDLAGTDVMRRFRTEATALARLNHPAIATVYQLFRAGTDLLMVMEFVRGETLEHLSQRLGPLAADRAAYVIDQLLWGVGHAHAAGVVHRDLKPSNVMLTPAGAVKIMDFGIARVRGTEHVTVDGSLLGTPAYMAPEQIHGGTVDGRADLYSIGVILYRLLTGALPFRVDTPMQMLQRQISDPPDPLHTHRPDLPEWCQSIVTRALAKSPADRFQTADEFREALEHGARILTRTDLAADLAQPDDAVHETADWPNRVAPRPGASGATLVSHRRPAPALMAAAAAGAIAIAGLGYVGLRPAASPAPAAVTPAAVAPVEPSAPLPSATASAPPVATVAPPEPARSVAPSPPPARPAVAVATARPAASPVAKAAVEQRPASSPVDRAESPVRASKEPAAAAEEASAPRPERAPVVFETKALLASGKDHKERDAKLALADGKIRVATENKGKQQVLHSVPYENVTSIDYSRGRSPLWMSPDGPAEVARLGGGALGLFRRDRHWITLQTSTRGQFVVLRTSESTAGKVLAELEARTGRRARVVNAKSGS